MVLTAHHRIIIILKQESSHWTDFYQTKQDIEVLLLLDTNTSVSPQISCLDLTL